MPDKEDKQASVALLCAPQPPAASVWDVWRLLDKGKGSGRGGLAVDCLHGICLAFRFSLRGELAAS